MYALKIEQKVQYLIPILRTKPTKTRSSMACQVVSKDMVVSMSNIPSLPSALLVLPTPLNIRLKRIYENSHYKHYLEKKYHINLQNWKLRDSIVNVRWHKYDADITTTSYCIDMAHESWYQL